MIPLPLFVWSLCLLLPLVAVQGRERSTNPFKCTEPEWECHESGQMIFYSKVCDGISDCLEGTDEDHCGMWHIIEAARMGNQTYVRTEIQQGFKVDTRGWQDWTLLLHASETGALSVVEELIEKDADVNFIVRGDCFQLRQREQGTTSLNLALMNNHQDVAIKLLDAGANYTYTDMQGRDASVFAASNNHLEFMKHLIDRVGRLDTQSKGSCLEAAAQAGNLEMLELLIKSPQIWENGEGALAFYRAVQNNFTSIAKVLQKSGLDLRYRGPDKEMSRLLYKPALEGNLPMVEVLLESGASVNKVIGGLDCDENCAEFGALEAAVRSNNWNIVEAILKSGDAGQPAFSDKSYPNGSYEISNKTEQRWNNEKSLALIIAHTSGHKDIYQKLLAYHYNNTDPTLKMDLKYTFGTDEVSAHMSILHYVVRDGSLAEVQQLVDVGAPVNQVPLCPLTMAVKRGEQRMVKYLLSKGAKPGQIGLQGMDFPLSAAVLIEGKTIFDNLITAGASTFAKFKYKGETPLFRAIREGLGSAFLLPKVEKLLNLETDSSAGLAEYPRELGFGKLKLLDMAAQRGLIDILNLLIKHIKKNSYGRVDERNLKSALLRAVQYNRPMAAKVLLNEINNVLYAGGNTAIQYHKKDIVAMKEFKNKALKTAARSGSLEIIRLLIQDKNVDINGAVLDNSHGEYMSPLMYAVTNGHMEAVNELLESGATINSQKTDGTKNSFTALHIAIQNNDAAMVKRLMRDCPNLHHLYKERTYREMATPDIREVILSQYNYEDCSAWYNEDIY